MDQNFLRLSATYNVKGVTRYKPTENYSTLQVSSGLQSFLTNFSSLCCFYNITTTLLFWFTLTLLPVLLSAVAGNYFHRKKSCYEFTVHYLLSINKQTDKVSDQHMNTEQLKKGLFLSGIGRDQHRAQSRVYE